MNLFFLGLGSLTFFSFCIWFYFILKKSTQTEHYKKAIKALEERFLISEKDKKKLKKIYERTYESINSEVYMLQKLEEGSISVDDLNEFLELKLSRKASK